MNLKALKKQTEALVDVEAITRIIAFTQRENGEIPWNPGAKTDPWDHVEAAIGLSIGGHFQKARKAYQWMADRQLTDGSWYSSYINSIPKDKTRESNMSSYLAVGLFHYYLMTGDTAKVFLFPQIVDKVFGQDFSHVACQRERRWMDIIVIEFTAMTILT